MRLMKVFSTALVALFAVIAGIFMALIVATGAMAALLLRRAIVRPRAAHATRGLAGSGSDDVIDVSATEVRADRFLG